MQSKYPGSCRVCGSRVAAGETIAYHGRGLGISCAACADEADTNEDDFAGLERGTLANDRRLASQGLTVVRTSSGAVWTQNRRGRCEDAPCCGCCS